MKKINVIALTLAFTAVFFTGCGNNNNMASSDAGISTTVSTTETEIIENSNPDFNDLDSNDDGILDDSELAEDTHNGVMTVIDDAVTMAEDVVSDVADGAENIVSDILE